MQHNIINCELCQKDFIFGPNIYRGSRNQTYQIIVCAECTAGNWDGWNPRFEDFLIGRLHELKIEVPTRLPNDLLPRE